MTDTLILTVDCAYPFDYSRAPKGTRVVLGYVGQLHETPHIWTAVEITAARRAIGAWAPIWTVPPTGLNAQVGMQSGNGMRAALEAMNYPKAAPVFLDVEHRTWAESPTRAIEGVDAWELTMAQGGWHNAHAYLPAAAKRGWAADWTGVRPTSLPTYLVGQQYAGGQDGDRYDLSVFRASIFDALLTKGTVTPVSLTTDDKAWIVAQLHAVQTNTLNYWERGAWDAWKDHPFPYSQKAIFDLVTKLHVEITQGLPASGGASALASQIAVALGPDIARAVAAELSKRLAT